MEDAHEELNRQLSSPIHCAYIPRLKYLHFDISKHCGPALSNLFVLLCPIACIIPNLAD